MKKDAYAFLASPWLFAASIAVFALFMAFVLPGQAAKTAEGTPNGASFDTSFFYTPAQAFDRAAAHTPEARFAYIAARWSFDLAFPLVYGLFALAGWAFGLTRPGPRMAARRLAPVALLGPAFDFAESIAATVIMASVPARPLGWGIAASIATPVKWLFVVVGIGGAVARPVAARIRALARRGSAPPGFRPAPLKPPSSDTNPRNCSQVGRPSPSGTGSRLADPG